MENKSANDCNVAQSSVSAWLHPNMFMMMRYDITRRYIAVPYGRELLREEVGE